MNKANRFITSGLPTSCNVPPGYHSGNCMLSLNEWSVKGKSVCYSLTALFGVWNFSLFSLYNLLLFKNAKA
jgi:hypothetical protein